MCEGVAKSGSLTGDKRMTCRSPRLTYGSLAAGVTLAGFTSILHLAGFTAGPGWLCGQRTYSEKTRIMAQQGSMMLIENRRSLCELCLSNVAMRSM